MRWRVVSGVTGEEIKDNDNGLYFQLATDGTLLTVDDVGHRRIDARLLGGYVLEFAFHTDENGEWLYENCVFSTP